MVLFPIQLLILVTDGIRESDPNGVLAMEFLSLPALHVKMKEELRVTRAITFEEYSLSFPHALYNIGEGKCRNLILIPNLKDT